MVDAVMLDVPPLPCVVRAGVFDAWGWCKSDTLEWRRPPGSESSTPRLDGAIRIRGENPPGLVFVMRDGSRATDLSLPCELARLHAFGYGLENEMALAPWGIDDATDQLYEHRARPHDIFWLAASSLAALVWGLHDWAHFHNHGPFDEPAMTELQCDLIALAWLRGNAERIGIHGEQLARIASDLSALARERFCDEGATPPTADFDTLFSEPYPSVGDLGG
jgi:hypothetical protein